MNKNWINVKLKDIADFKYGKSLPERDRQAGDFSVYGSGGIVDTHNQCVAEKGIIVGRKGSIGSVYYSDKSFFQLIPFFILMKFLKATI